MDMKKAQNLENMSEYGFVKVRNIENYLDKIRLKSPGTVKNIRNYLNRFDSYLQETYKKSNQQVLDEILSMKNNKERAIFDILQDFVNSLSGKKNFMDSNNISSGYVRHCIYAIKGYLRFYGFTITSDDLKDSITLPKVIEEEREPLQRQQLQLILNNQTGLRRVLYLFMSSSGMRPSEALQIRKRDLELEKYERIMIRIPARITKTKKPRITFISKECEKELLPFLKRMKDDDFIFNPKNKTVEQIRLSELQIFGRLRAKIGLLDQYESGVYKVSLGDSLRSWFVTKCNRVDYGFGHALAGHDQYMKRYDRLTLDEKMELYLKSEELLQAFDYTDENQLKKIDEKNQQRILEQNEKIKTLEKSLKSFEEKRKRRDDEWKRSVMKMIRTFKESKRR